MNDHPALGSLEPFKDWFTPRPWGPSSKRASFSAIEDMEQRAEMFGEDPKDRWRASFGPGVVVDLVKGLRAHPAAVERRFPRKAEAYPVVLGCVPWLTSKDVVNALVRMNCCVVVDKGAKDDYQVARLSREGTGVLQQLLGDLEYWGRAEGGRPPIIGPSTPRNEQALEPVRLVGYKRGAEPAPLLHAKLAVCCAAYTWETDMGGGWEDHLLPISAWIGSANWTEQSSLHLEFGAWTTDPALANAAFEFLTDLIKVSEPWESQAPQPSPELVAAEWDDDAFAETVAASEREYDPDEYDFDYEQTNEVP